MFFWFFSGVIFFFFFFFFWGGGGGTRVYPHIRYIIQSTGVLPLSEFKQLKLGGGGRKHNYDSLN